MNFYSTLAELRAKAQNATPVWAEIIKASAEAVMEQADGMHGPDRVEMELLIAKLNAAAAYMIESGKAIPKMLAVIYAAKALQDLPFDISDNSAAIACNGRLDDALRDLESGPLT